MEKRRTRRNCKQSVSSKNNCDQDGIALDKKEEAYQDHEESVGSNNVSTTNRKMKERYPQDSSLRNKPCRRYIKLCTMFNRNTAMGSRAHSSAQLLPDLMEDKQLISDYSIDLDNDLASQSVPTSSGHSKRKRVRQPGLDRVIRSFETTQTITSAQKCKDVMATLHEMPGMSVVTRVKVADYFAKNEVELHMFLACNPDERREYVNLISNI